MPLFGNFSNLENLEIQIVLKDGDSCNGTTTSFCLNIETQQGQWLFIFFSPTMAYCVLQSKSWELLFLLRFRDNLPSPFEGCGAKRMQFLWQPALSELALCDLSGITTWLVSKSHLFQVKKHFIFLNLTATAWDVGPCLSRQSCAVAWVLISELCSALCKDSQVPLLITTEIFRLSSRDTKDLNSRHRSWAG